MTSWAGGWETRAGCTPVLPPVLKAHHPAMPSHRPCVAEPEGGTQCPHGEHQLPFSS